MTDSPSQEAENPKGIGKYIRSFDVPKHFAGVAAVLTFSVYVTGFISVNTYLLSFGFHELVVLSPNYLVAGVLFITFLIVVWIFPGRFLFSFEKRLEARALYFSEDVRARQPIRLEAVSFIIFQTTLAATLFTTFFVSGTNNLLYFSAVGVYFFVHVFLDRTDLDVKYPSVSLHLDIILQSIVVGAFFINGTFDIIFLMVWIIILVVCGFTAFARWSSRGRELTLDFIVFAVAYSFIFTSSVAVMFARSVYPEIGKNFGGGKPISAYVSFNDDDVCSQLSQCADKKAEFEIIYASNDYTILLRDSVATKIDNSLIRFISADQAEESAPSNEFVEFRRRLNSVIGRSAE